VRARRWLCAALLLGAICAGAAEDDVALRFANADIESVVKLVSEITGRSFVLDPRVKGTISIVSSRPVPRSQVYALFLSALRLQGFAIIEDGGLTKIVPEADAKVNPGPTIGPDARAAGDRVTTLVYPLQHESAAQLLPVLRPLIPANNTIAVLPGSNTLVITDYASNISRLKKILEAVDRAETAEITVIALQHASAIDITPTLVRLMPEGTPAPAAGGPPPRPLITPDARSNSLFVRSANPAITARVVDLVAKLDVPARSPGNVNVIYLRNAEAAKVAETLRGLAAAEAKPAAAPGQPAAAPQTSFIQADAGTNSLLIAAPDHVYNTLRRAVEQLDVRSAQVYLEALVAEVTTDRAAELGIQFQSLSGAGAGTNATRVIGGTNFDTTPGSSILGAAQNIGSVGPGLNLGVIRGRVTLPGVGEVLNLAALARALQSDAQANVLSTPNLLTLDNEEAKIVVGQNVPFVTGSYSQAGSGAGAGASTVNPFQTIDRRDVGLTLRVKPQIAEGRTVKLRIYQEVSSIQDVTNAAGIITNKRSIESAVLVEDGEIVVLGGLVQDDVKTSVDKIPLLGDLPIIGYLFRYEARRRVKTNLMVFLRPVVLREPGAAAAITADRYEYIRNEQAGVVAPPRALLPALPTPELPEP
jgi:general secretion pathway protein D